MSAVENQEANDAKLRELNGLLRKAAKLAKEIKGLRTDKIESLMGELNKVHTKVNQVDMFS